jgi:hypothetical protein
MPELSRLPTPSKTDTSKDVIANAYRLAGSIGLQMLDDGELAGNICEFHRQFFRVLALFCPSLFSNEHRQS